MRFGQTHVLKTAKGKIAIGIALIFFGAIAVLAAPTASDRLLCGAIVPGGLVFIFLGIRQDRTEKEQIRKNDGKAD